MGNYLPPGAAYEYKPPSVFVQYRVLTIVFALVALSALLYWAIAPRLERRHQAESVTSPTIPAESAPVYVQPISPR